MFTDSSPLTQCRQQRENIRSHPDADKKLQVAVSCGHKAVAADTAIRFSRLQYVSFSEKENVRWRVSIGILQDMASLDFKSPFDELTELRAVLTTQEIAELTGLRRETISRARPDSRFQRRTGKALGDLYLVVTKMKSVAGGDLGQLAAILRRPQTELAGRSIAELLREGKVEAVLKSLSPDAPTEAEEPTSFRLDPEIAVRPEPWKEPSENVQASDPALDARVTAVLEEDPELRARLSAIEAALVRHFGPGAEVKRKIVSEFYDDLEGSDELYLRVYDDLSLDENIDRLATLLEREGDLLAPVRARLTIGFLG
jgi:hypothetical protein